MRPRIAFAYDEVRTTDAPDGDDPGLLDDVAAEYEDARTIAWMRRSLGVVGEVVDLPWGSDFAVRLSKIAPDVVFNITEAAGSRNRESLVPAIAEGLGIPCTASDAVALGISLDKMITKVIAADLGIPTPRARLVPGFRETRESDLRSLRFPVILKPNTGGSSIGIHRGSVFGDAGEALREAAALSSRLGEATLVEEFVSGRELTVSLLEIDGELTALPVAEVRVGHGAPDEFYSIERKSRHEKQVVCPADHECVDRLVEWSKLLFRRLGCRDLARVDFRVSRHGAPFLLEINPLPGLSPYYSIFPRQAAVAEISPEGVLAILVRNAESRGKNYGKRTVS